MKKQGKHIRYLKIFLELVVDNILFIALTIFLCIFFLCNSQLINWGINLLRKVGTKILANVAPQNRDTFYNITIKFICFILGPLISFFINRFLSNIFTGKKNLFKIRRYLYFKFKSCYIKSQNRILQTVIPWMINIFLHGEPLCYYNQNDHIMTLMKCLGVGDSKKNIVWIKGDAYSGKTTIIFRFIEELTHKKNLALFEEYEKHIYYFDMGTPSLNISTIYKSIGNREYDNALLILDNIHKLEFRDLRFLIATLESNYTKVKFLICLSRQFEDFCFSQELYARIDEFCHNYAEEININPMQNDATNLLDPDRRIRDEIEASTFNAKENYQMFCHRIMNSKPNDIVLMVQCYNLYSSTSEKSNRKFIFKVFDTINTGRGDTSLKYILSFVIHATLFSGGFELSWLREYIENLKGIKILFYAKYYFYKLQKSSFISIVCLSDSYEVVFHEKLARHYFEIIDKNEKYKEINLSIIKYLLKKNKEYGRFVNAWKYNVLLQPEFPNDSILFDKSLYVANFKTLLEDLQYILKEKKNITDSLYRELGILFDRSGQLDKAAECFKKALKHNFNPAIYINLIQVDHSEYDEEQMQLLVEEKNNAYIRIAARYWKAHIDIHDGKFQFEDFSNLLDEWKTYKGIVLTGYPYDGLHLLRRWYFDCFRVYYLSGILNQELLRPIIEADLFENIENLPEFEAYRYKFQYAFFLHYDILFEKGIWNTVNYDDLKNWDKLRPWQEFCIKLKAAREHGESEVDLIVTKAINYYRLSSDGLKKIMDKSYRYSDLRVYELKLAYMNINQSDIYKNEEFIKDYIQHSKDIHVDEYVAYGYTYLLKNYLVGQYCLSPEYDDNPYEGKILKNTYITDEIIQDCFTNIEQYHNNYRGARKNIYCMFRLNIYKTLYRYMRNNINYIQAETDVRELYDEAIARNYRREIKLLKHLLENKLVRTDIINFYKYYPLVMQ